LGWDAVSSSDSTIGGELRKATPVGLVQLRGERAYDLAVSMPPTAPHPIRRAAIANLGCKVNQAEMDAVERLLRARRVELVGAHEPADLVVVNTCTVTSIADQKSRQAVRRARRTSPDAQVFVTGCSVAVDAESLAAADPAALLFGNESKRSC
jgi:hypothetical protein